VSVNVYFALGGGDSSRMQHAIEGMKSGMTQIYFAMTGGGSSGGHQWNGALREAKRCQEVPELSLLMSYHYFSNKSAQWMRDQFPDIKTRIFIDSGGFSAMTLGEPVRLKDYARYLVDNKSAIDVYANLDAVGDGDKTHRNQTIMEAEGLSPIPVFHVNTDFRHLDRILERGYPYIALGGMVPYMRGGGKKKLAVWLRQVFARIGKRDVKVHGFGVGTTWKIASGFPWYSIDSSSWVRGFKYRVAAIFDDERGHFIPIDLGSSSRDAMKYADVIRRYGFSPRDFYPHYNDLKAGALSVMSLLRAEAWLRDNRREGLEHGEEERGEDERDENAEGNATPSRIRDRSQTGPKARRLQRP
jgi:hypothetical protein